MNALHTFLERRLHSHSSSGAHGSKGAGDKGTGPDRERGSRSAAAGSRRSWNVSAAGEFPRFAAQNDDRKTDGVSVNQGNVVRISAYRISHKLRIPQGNLRTAGAGGSISHPLATAGHARTTGRKQGARVTGSGVVAVGAMSIGVSLPPMWENARTEAEAPGLPSLADNRIAGRPLSGDNPQHRAGSASNRETTQAHSGSASYRETTQTRSGNAKHRETPQTRSGNAKHRD
ncbi:MAG: hypothetical protein WAV84_11105 [Bacteroidota bacterium]